MRTSFDVENLYLQLVQRRDYRPSLESATTEVEGGGECLLLDQGCDFGVIGKTTQEGVLKEVGRLKPYLSASKLELFFGKTRADSITPLKRARIPLLWAILRLLKGALPTGCSTEQYEDEKVTYSGRWVNHYWLVV